MFILQESALYMPRFSILAVLAFVCCGALSVAINGLKAFRRNLSWWKGPRAHVQQQSQSSAHIESLRDFDITRVDPIKYRPYKTQGHVTMGIQKRTRSDWIRMDSGYLNRIAERRQVLAEHPKEAIGTGPLVDHAIEELYEEIMIDYLPQRYPTIFKIKEGHVHNKVTGCSYPYTTRGMTHEQMLVHLSDNVEEDFYFMMPSPADGEFRLQGYIACFPGGFLSPARVGESVREIHQPVPGYEERLGKSVDRYFKRMVPGQFIGRMNWSLQVDGRDLFRTDGNNFYPSTEQTVDKAKEDPALSDCYLRVEHQTLTALPRSKAIIFCVRSYMTSLEDIRREGEGPALVEAIKSMPTALGSYKMRPYWAGKVLPWLQGQA